MKKSKRWQFFLAMLLVSMSLIVYSIHYAIFHDLHHILIYLIEDIAFIFLEVLIVSVVLHQLLGFREKQAIHKKINMIIGAFFSELGLELLKQLNSFNKGDECCFKKLKLDTKENVTFKELKKACDTYAIDMDFYDDQINDLKYFLGNKRSFIIRLLENPSILEHNTFSDMVWAVVHLSDELTHRVDLAALTDKDKDHIKIDMTRAYKALINEWVLYMEHLSKDYPFLYSFAVRKNPFNKNACIEIT
jgi:hypothetical protein